MDTKTLFFKKMLGVGEAGRPRVARRMAAAGNDSDRCSGPPGPPNPSRCGHSRHLHKSSHGAVSEPSSESQEVRSALGGQRARAQGPRAAVSWRQTGDARASERAGRHVMAALTWWM